MSLNWTILQDPTVQTERLEVYGEQAGSMIYTISGLMLNVGIQQITEANAGEFFARIKLHEALHGAARIGAAGPVFTTADDVRLHIGLRTNVSNLTRRGFLTKHIEHQLDRSVNKYRIQTTTPEGKPNGPATLV